MKSSGKPVPVKWASSQSPFACCVRAEAIRRRDGRPGCRPRLQRRRLIAPTPFGKACWFRGRARPARRRSGCPRRSRRPRSAPSRARPTARLIARWPGSMPHGLQRGQRGAGAVDVVDAPAAEPRAVRLLLAQQPVEPAAHLVVEAGLRRERLERVRGDVGARLVGDLAEVAERELVEPVAPRCRRRRRPSRRCATASRPSRRARGRRRRGRGGNGAARARRRRCRPRPGRGRSRTRTPSRPGASSGVRTAQSPATVTSSLQEPVGGAHAARGARGRGRSRAARARRGRCPRPATGTPRAAAGRPRRS